MRELIARYRWAIVVGASALVVGFIAWFVLSDASGFRYLVRLYQDKRLLKQTLNEWGILAPVFFILLQALQVIISPIPGEATGFLGGYLFGAWGGFIYSTIGLTLGSVRSPRAGVPSARGSRMSAQGEPVGGPGKVKIVAPALRSTIPRPHHRRFLPEDIGTKVPSIIRRGGAACQAPVLDPPPAPPSLR
jgi:hypothetical protein